MKFTKEQLLDTLKGKLTANGKHLSISEKTIKSLSDSHYDLLVNEETELDDLVNKILPQYTTLNGNYEKDNSDFIKKWREEHPNVIPQEGKEGNQNKPSDETQKLLERIELLERKNAEIEETKIISQKRDELILKLNENGIKNAKWAEQYVKKLNITKDFDIEKEAVDALDFYNLSNATNKVITPGTPNIDDNFNIKADRWKGVNKLLGTDTAQ